MCQGIVRQEILENQTKKGREGESQPEEEEMIKLFISPMNSEYQNAGGFKYHTGCIL